MSDRIAVCQHPDGDGLYVAAEDITGGRCFEPGCDCTPRVYVAVEAVRDLLDRAFHPQNPTSAHPVDVLDRYVAAMGEKDQPA